MKKNTKPKFKTQKKKVSVKYLLFVFLMTFAIACLMEALTDVLLEHVYVSLSFVILLAVILIGIIFDIIGVATTSADPVPFHSMAADKVKGAKEAIMLLNNAEKVSNICNDVIGDVCGIVSGGISAFIIASININDFSFLSVWSSVLLSGIVSALTVGGKAISKYFSISCSNSIVYTVGKIFAFFKFRKN